MRTRIYLKLKTFKKKSTFLTIKNFTMKKKTLTKKFITIEFESNSIQTFSRAI